MAARLTSRIRSRAMNWALRRQGNDALPLTLAARRIYILPTRPGWIFAMLILVTFVAGMNYGNGLALLLAFWMTGFSLVAMVQTQRNLAGARIISASADPAFAGDSIAVSVAFAPRGAPGDLVLSVHDDAQASSGQPDNRFRLHIPGARRGRWRAPPLRITSIAPFGLFRSWTWLSLDVSTVVYPRPEGTLPLPETPGDDGNSGRLSSGQEELAWLREFRDGDSPRQVAWKAYARGAPLLVREYRGHAMASRDFDFSGLQDPDVEARLSQLARWCLEAASRCEHWTLRLPGSPPLAGQDTQHLESCLRRLALHGIPDRP